MAHADGRGNSENGMPFSQTVGCVTVLAQACAYCHKQYATRAKVLQHQRKTHPEIIGDSLSQKHIISTQELSYVELPKIEGNDLMVENNETGTIVVLKADDILGNPSKTQEIVRNADLLTEAMTELSHLDYSSGVVAENKTAISDATLELVQGITNYTMADGSASIIYANKQ